MSHRSDQRSDRSGLLRLVGHLGTLTVTGTALVRCWSTPWVVPIVVAHGFVLVFLFCAEHECVHRTAFRARRANDAVAAGIGVLLLLPSTWFRLFHAAHHRFTQDPLQDPELDGWKPASRSGIVLQMTGLLYWKAMGQVVWNVARGRAEATWLPSGHRRRVVRQVRVTLLLYVALVVGSVATRSWVVVQLWLLPVFAGQPFLRWYLLAEHTGCPTGQGVVVGTRTTLTNPVMRFFAWNMPFHREHHAHPQVPFHALPALHSEWLADGAPHEGLLDRGYVRTVARLQRQRWRAAPRSPNAAWRSPNAVPPVPDRPFQRVIRPVGG